MKWSGIDFIVQPCCLTLEKQGKIFRLRGIFLLAIHSHSYRLHRSDNFFRREEVSSHDFSLLPPVETATSRVQHAFETLVQDRFYPGGD